jgi:chromodomain-helicase-DNA-binding protein 4
MSSDDDPSALMAAFKKGAPPKKVLESRASRPASPPRKQASSSPGQSILADESGNRNGGTGIQPVTLARKAVAVVVAPVRNRAEYTYYEPQDTVDNIVREFQRKGHFIYEVKLTNGRIQQVREFALHSVPHQDWK